MEPWWLAWLLSLTVGLFSLDRCVVWAQTKITKSEDGLSGTISYSTPDLNNEEGHSPWIPDQLKCDACKIVAYQFWAQLSEYNRKRKSLKHKLPVWEILDLIENICENDNTWQGYGIKQVDNINRLSGIGTDTADVPGITAGGGKWPARLHDLCKQFMGRVGEEKIYGVYKKKPKDRKTLEDFLCRGPANTVRGECSKVDEIVYTGDGSPVFGAKRATPVMDNDYDDDDDDDNDADVEDDDDDFDRDEL